MLCEIIDGPLDGEIREIPDYIARVGGFYYEYPDLPMDPLDAQYAILDQLPEFRIHKIKYKVVSVSFGIAPLFESHALMKFQGWE